MKAELKANCQFRMSPETGMTDDFSRTTKVPSG
jgi:hypothetical protein